MLLVLMQEGLLNQFNSALFRNHAPIMRFALRSANRYSCHGRAVHQREGNALVIEHPLLKAVVELPEHPVEEVPQGLHVPVPPCPAAPVVGVRAA